MGTPKSTIQTIMAFVESHQFVLIKCADDSEKFIYKDGDFYRISTDRRFKEDKTESYRSAEPIINQLGNIRGYGTYKQYDYTPMQLFTGCGCDS